jgi:hypothetical protein
MLFVKLCASKGNYLFKVLFQVCVLSLAIGLSASLSHAANGAPVVFSVPKNFNPKNVYVSFLGGTVTGKYYDKTTGYLTNLQNQHPYSLDDLTSPVSVGGNAPINVPAVYITDWTAGRLYMSLGTGVTAQPNPANKTDSLYNVRYFYFETNFNSTGVHVDISYIDCVSMGYSLRGVNTPHAKNNPLLTPVSTRTLATIAAQAATPLFANVVPSAKAILPEQFVRVLAPMSSPDPPTDPNPLYHDWTNYLKTTLSGKTIHIKGCYGGGGVSSHPETLVSQSYDYNATFDANGNATLTAKSDSGIYNPT